MLLSRVCIALLAAAASARRASQGGAVRATRPVPRIHRKFSVSDSQSNVGNIEVWPLPSNPSAGVGNARLNPSNFTVVYDRSDAFLVTVVERFHSALFWSPSPAVPADTPTLHNLTLAVVDATVRVIQQDVDESYTLTFSTDGSAATIIGATIFGVRHGLETFVQLSSCPRATGIYTVQLMNLTDTPRFPFRGLLVDSARHWLPPAVLLSVMDGMAMNKLNALQVGFGIDWAYTAKSAAFPNLTLDTAYGPPGTHMYSRETIAWLAAEANYRGVRLIPYIEAVSHDGWLGEAMPQLMYCNGKNGSGMPHPLHAATWAFFDAFWADMKAIFPDEYLNYGGDEVDITCWQQDPEINAWMAKNGYPAGNWDYIVAHFYSQMIASLAKAGFKAIMFAEAFGALNRTGVDLTGTGIIFDGWDEGTPGSLADVIQAPGVRAIVSSYCFLAPTQNCPDNLPGGATPNWFTNINCEIQNASLFPAAAVPFLDRIVGGHPSRWGEQTDGTNIFQFAWPALLGAAEKLWSPLNFTNGSLYGQRQEVFADHRCVQVRRGVPIQPTSAYSWACEYEWEPAYPPLTPLHPNPYPYSSWGAPNSTGSDAAAAALSPPPLSPQPPSAREVALEAALSAARERIAELEHKLAI